MAFGGMNMGVVILPKNHAAWKPIARALKGIEEAAKEVSAQEVQRAVFDFIRSTTGPIKDDELHKWAEAQGIDVPMAEAAAYNLLGDFLRTWKDGDLNPDELARGMEIESEHSDNPIIQEKIARDHLAEDADYYEKLDAAGL